MSIIYIATLISLGTIFITIKKTDKKENILTWTAITVVLLLCYNIFIVYILNLFNIFIKLGLLSVINVVFTGILLYYCIKRKVRQKYYIEIKDIIYTFLIILIIIVVSLMYFGYPLQIRYMMTDSAVHYKTAIEFYNNSSLLNDISVEYIGTKGMIPGAYINIGLLFKSLDNCIEKVDFYKIFISFDIFLLCLAAVIMYVTLKKYAKNWRVCLIAFILSIIYTLGYPLNSLMSGYLYLSIGLIIINSIILIMDYIKENQMRFSFNHVVLFLLTFGLFFNYYFFVPVVYGSIAVFLTVESYKKTKKLLDKKNILNIFILLVIPGICGIAYHILPNLLKTTSMDITNQVYEDGYIYRNLYSNIIIFLPIIVIWLLDKKNKTNENDFNILLLIFTMIFIIVLLAMVVILQQPTYYLFKMYFLLWIVIIYIFFKGIEYIDSKNKYVSLIYLSVYITIIIVSSIFTNVSLEEINPHKHFNTSEKITGVAHIFNTNKIWMDKNPIDYNIDELEILRFANKNLDFCNDNIAVVGNIRQMWWFYAITGYLDDETFDTVPSDINSDEYNFIVYFNKSGMFRRFRDEIFGLDGEHIFKNSGGGVIWKLR